MSLVCETVEGVRHVLYRERFVLHMKTEEGREVKAEANDFDALLELRSQLGTMGYFLVNLAPIPQASPGA